MRGQGGMVAGLLGLMVLVLIAYVVVLPLMETATATSYQVNGTFGSAGGQNLSGGAVALTTNLGLFVVLGVVLAIIGLFILRGQG